MKFPCRLEPHFSRFSTILSCDDPSIPRLLFAKTAPVPPDLSDFPYPLPSAVPDYTCFSECGDITWYGARTGLTRFDPKAKYTYDRVMYFSADRDLPDNDVLAVYAVENGAWVRTASGVTRIELRDMTCEERSDMLRSETKKYVDRHGLVSQKYLAVPRDVSTAVAWGHSDNDGEFTSHYALGELFRYAVLKREKGAGDQSVIEAKASAARAVEACMLLMRISGRGDGFVARSFVTKDEPVPDDGLFYRKSGGKAVCLKTRASERMGYTGLEQPASAPVPDRLAALYRSEGYSDDDIIYKGDTSSDEITGHYINLLYAYDLLGPDDPELAALISETAGLTMGYIIDCGFEMHEFPGRPTTWARWSPEYFETIGGWFGSPLNAAEILMYLLVTIHVTGDPDGKFRAAYDKLVSLGYAETTVCHYERFTHGYMAFGLDLQEALMYGCNSLATLSFWGLTILEKDPGLLALYRQGFKNWRSTTEREHNPGYDFPYILGCPDESIDMDKIAEWFYRTNPSRLAASVSLLGRHDVPVRARSGGYLETGFLLPPDERFISKYDRNPLQYRNEDSGGIHCVESCYVYTLPYWMGRYYGFIEE